MRPVIDSNIQNFAVANLRRRPEPVETGGFVVGIDPSTTSHHVNYATPLPGIEPTSADVAALVSAFRERGLTPRLEFAPNAAPAVEAALYAAGFTVEEEHEYLVCVRDSLVPPDNPPLVEAPETDADYLAVDAALAEAFGDEFTPSPQGVARLRRIGEMGGAVRLVRAPDGDCAGAASCSAPAVGTSELAGVGTRPAYRGRGIAAAVTASLTALMFAKGNESVWLEYGGDGSRRVYERIGYRPAGRRLYVSIPG
ncbi:MAG TPA: GNAT family N-acetyltransferase [Pseudonocardiaceae bacterium]